MNQTIESQCVYSKFPQANFLIAVFDTVKEFYLDEFQEVATEEQVSNIDNWNFAGVGIDSPGSYFVMDMVKIFYNLKSGEIILLNDHDINDGGLAFTPLRAEDAKVIYTYDYNENIEGLLCM